MKRSEINNLKIKMRQEYLNFLDQAHTQEKEVKNYQEDKYFLLDGEVVWIPDYLYKLRTYLKYSLQK